MDIEDIKKLVLNKYQGTHSGDNYKNFHYQLTRFLKESYSDYFKNMPSNITSEEAADYIYNFLDRNKDKFRDLMDDIKNTKLTNSYKVILTQVEENNKKSNKIVELMPELAGEYLKNPIDIKFLNFKLYMAYEIKNKPIYIAIENVCDKYSEICLQIIRKKIMFCKACKYFVDTNALIDFLHLSEFIISDVLKYAILFNDVFTYEIKANFLNKLNKFIDKNYFITYLKLRKENSKKLPYKEDNKIDKYSEYQMRYLEFASFQKITDDINYILDCDMEGNTANIYSLPAENNINTYIRKAKKLVSDKLMLEDNPFRDIGNNKELRTVIYEIFINDAKYYPSKRINSDKKSLQKCNKKGKKASTILKELDSKKLSTKDDLDKIMFLDLKIVRGYFRDCGIITLYPLYHKLIKSYHYLLSNSILTSNDIFIYTFAFDYTCSILEYMGKLIQSLV